MLQPPGVPRQGRCGRGNTAALGATRAGPGDPTHMHGAEDAAGHKV
jgi:hypothetical protein